MIVISFESTNYAMLADKYFDEINFQKMVVPTPRAISNSCGISLQINKEDIEKAKVLIQEKHIKIKGIFEVDKNTAVQLL
ncbi:hypothetical protein HMPREF9630_01829 [Peptoanaerobacter stomatis]|jgi:hypothetical protein|uniref:PF11823 family protein n=1 Tax=Peptoanaerobacter stomatis TaxID=796937 RepID=G9WXJ9_9FIRM|nr:DUF3343 domain-containing protein [Peptoanaerobacter stomatis]NWO24317.1 DUF3343 domain-containing protein [Peptostreptococcaceae bacterium oral taxon 081]EHL16740.1 hypothetical protein HMPREF9630_01829 [Peptoanaerobacter stomatis]EHL16846.1 hypothetical protein HMPREF9629_00088 [Peptoanaerobacter stomatis]EHL18808.1 hypothetical protein HMPREF9628_00494 [Peptoanaerobacter stomatis]EJU23658.1 PF11823 family protein [Peptoanaerobacter stomatis]